VSKPYYADDLVTIYHGDAREILPTMAPASVDFIWTDPPYGHNNNNGDLAHRREAALGLLPIGASAPAGRPIANDGPEANELVQWFFGEADRLLKAGCCCCCCCGGGGPDPQFARWALWMDGAIGFKQAVVWDKGGLGMGWHYRRNYEFVLVAEKPGAAGRWFGGRNVANVVRVPGIKPGADDHPTPKPYSLVKRFMGWHYRRNYEFILVAQKRGAAGRWFGGRNVANVVRVPGIKPSADDHPTPKPYTLVKRFMGWHSQPGDLVLDPFMGGGPTLVVAKDMGRRAIGIDVEERWCEMAAVRCSQEVLGLGA